MKRHERLGEARAPDGTTMTLWRHDRDYTIRIGDVDLMSTRRHHSEERLAELACAHLQGQRGACVLIGGLGLGFTLEAALRLLPRDAHVVVCELVEEVITWNRTFDLAGSAVDDPRVELRRADVAAVLRESAGAFDAIILDIDNGADALTSRANAALYRPAGIAAALHALRAHGVLGYWSSSSDKAFADLLRGMGLTLEVTHARAHTTSGPWHTLLIARRG